MNKSRILFFICVIITWHCGKGDSINEKCEKKICDCNYTWWGDSYCDTGVDTAYFCYDGLDCILKDKPSYLPKFCRDLDCEGNNPFMIEIYEKCKCQKFTVSTTTTETLPTSFKNVTILTTTSESSPTSSKNLSLKGQIAPCQ